MSSPRRERATVRPRASADKYHGVGKFNVVTGAQAKSAAKAPSYTKVFADSAHCGSGEDGKIVAITAAMPDGTGLDRFAKEFPERDFDVGIAEQHAVTFAAGLPAEGNKPFATIYSTFLQRAYDQVVHDVAVQGLPVRFAIDRAGLRRGRRPDPCRLVRRRLSRLPPRYGGHGGEPTRPSSCTWSRRSTIEDRPSAFRYPRGEGTGIVLPKRGSPLPIGKGRMLREGSAVAHAVVRRAAPRMR